jgi:IclR family transcriptional regulator, arginine deiminase pathway regulator
MGAVRMRSMNEAQNPVQGVEKSIRILETLKKKEGASLTELADDLGLTKGAVHHHISTLKQYRFVVENKGEYTLGLRFTVFGEHVRNQSQLYQVAKPEVIELANETGEYSHLTTEQHGLGMKLFKHQGEMAVGSEYQIAKLQQSECLHYTATGKAILAHLPRDRVERIIDHYGLPRRTSETITSPEVLYDELADVERQGFANNDEEEVEGIRAVGAPIIDRTDEVLGAISVSGPMSRIDNEQFHDYLPDVVTRAANVIEVNLNMRDRSDQLGELE